MAGGNRDVFVNCPFDQKFKPLFHAIAFTVIRSGFRVRCALEADDAAQNRFDKVCAIVRECQYGVHDISRTEVSGRPRLPRFNMPLELGVFLGATQYGGREHKAKRCIIFDRAPYRFQSYISDIAGQDIHSHDCDEATLIRELAGWLRAQSHDPLVPGGNAITREFRLFKETLPAIGRARQLGIGEMTFGDINDIMVQYVKS